MRRTTAAAVLAACGTLIAPASAQAHISLHPNTIPAGAFATLDVRVPGEQEGAYVTKVDTLFPPGFTGVDYENVPGWSTKVIETKLATPIKSRRGNDRHPGLSDRLDLDRPAGQGEQRPVHQLPALAGDPGRRRRARRLNSGPSRPTATGRSCTGSNPSLTAEHPSPRINVTAKGGVIEEVAGDEAGPEAGQTAASQSTPASGTATAKSSSGASKGLGITALILGALGLIVGLVASLIARGDRGPVETVRAADQDGVYALRRVRRLRDGRLDPRARWTSKLFTTGVRRGGGQCAVAAGPSRCWQWRCAAVGAVVAVDRSSGASSPAGRQNGARSRASRTQRTALPACAQQPASRAGGTATGHPGTEPVPILMYHVIAAPPAGAPFPGLYVTPSEFAAQVQALKSAGWHAVTLDQVEAYWTQGRAARTRANRSC